MLAKKLGNYTLQRAAEKAEAQRLLDEKAKADHEAACEKSAQEMDASGETVAAEAIREMKSEAPATEQLTEPELMSKTKFRVGWELVSTSIASLPIEYLTINESKILQMIRASKGQIKINGVEYKEVQIPIRHGE